MSALQPPLTSTHLATPADSRTSGKTTGSGASGGPGSTGSGHARRSSRRFNFQVPGGAAAATGTAPSPANAAAGAVSLATAAALTPSFGLHTSGVAFTPAHHNLSTPMFADVLMSPRQ
jgi:hypothetical protein